MTLLGVVLAGGRSSRFGTDKAWAEIAGQTLLERAIAALGAQCDGVCMVGRSVPGFAEVADWPDAGRGPLGGLAGAMLHARQHGFAEILTSAVDIPDLPADLAELLHPSPSYVADQPVVGRWRVDDLETLQSMLRVSKSVSMKAFCRACDARPVRLTTPLANINTQADLARFVTQSSDTAGAG